LTIGNIADDAQYERPAFTQLFGVVLKYLEDTLELSLAYVYVTDGTELLQR